MCSVCDAAAVIKANQEGQTATFAWTHGPAGLVLEVQGEAASPEFSPGKLRLRRGEEGEWSEWTEWVETDDLAGSLGRLGTDIKWRFVPCEVKMWFKGGDFGPVLDRLVKPLAAPLTAPVEAKRGRPRSKKKGRKFA